MIQPSHLQKLISQMATTQGNKEINANLPMLLRILSKQGDNKYLIQLGKLVIETQSNKELTVGARYWANVKQGQEGLIISDLIKQPRFLENLANSKLKLSSQDLREIINDTQNGGRNIDSVFKDFLLDRLPLATTKQEFLELSNLLIALQNGVFSMVIKEDNGNESLVQMKKQIDFLEFYSIFTNLGEISGTIMLDEDKSLKLKLYVMNEKVKGILNRNLHDLHNFSDIEINVGESSPLWDLDKEQTQYILNLKG